jgi:hypothetical protein
MCGDEVLLSDLVVVVRMVGVRLRLLAGGSLARVERGRRVRDVDVIREPRLSRMNVG